MKIAKKYTVSTESKSGEPRTQTGTLQELISYYSYTLEVGNSWNKKVNRNPKTIKSFVDNYNKAVDEKYGGYFRPYMSLVTE